MTDLFSPNSNDPATDPAPRPLPDQLRPTVLSEVAGQEHLTAEGMPLQVMAAGGKVSSTIFWGPPGCGKTTLARIVAQSSGLHFEQLSAIFAGVKDLKTVFDAARHRRANGKQTLLFVDEIHRFMKSQQDAFLPVVEDGTIILFGATTENPSFELNAPLLSRCQVLVLKRLSDVALETLLQRAEERKEIKLPLTDRARELLKTLADGDGRYCLAMAEQVFDQPGTLDEKGLMTIVQRRAPLYDKSDEGHYNLISALHKSVRGSDPDAALYWMARMLAGGEDPLYIARRMTRMATEDIGLADPRALTVCISAWETYDRLGSPEGELALAQAIVYLATAPKSVAVYKAFGQAKKAAQNTGSLMPPKHILNAPTKLMKDVGYSDGYIYDPDTPESFSGQDYFPEEIGRQTFYQPVDRGFESEVRKRLDYWARLRKEKRKAADDQTGR
ncbi:MAG: replication-associated recombination protein A [Candidatus Omnitrophica bacterium]|nr:replication-associated recombination protein A [Candidatus Omnitrophota bacterium]MCB9719947.1 replication-associated recombination protein A [Candidatus Omnitrophota bacterium]